MKRVLIGVCLLVATSVYAQAPFDRPDGNFWLSLTRTTSDATMIRLEKVEIVIGALQGLWAAHHMTFQVWADDPNEPYNPKAVDRRVDEIEKAQHKYVSGVRPTQIVDGLDRFYGDYANRRIDIGDALWAVLRTIAGDDAKEIDEFIVNRRQAAAARQD